MEEQHRLDGVMNVLNGIGTMRYDPSRWMGITRTQFITMPMSENLFIENGVFKKIVKTPADEALRAGFCIETEDDHSDACEKVQSVYEDLGGEEKFATALYWHRCYGGGVLLPIFDDGADSFTEPLNENALRRIEEIRVYSAKEVIPWQKEDDAASINYGKPKTYMINDESTGASFDVDASRLILFPGLEVPNVVRNGRDGWGGMILEQVYNALITKYDLGNKYAIDIMERMAQGVLKIQDLINILSSEDGEERVRKYLQNIDMVRNVLNTLAIDAGDDYDIKGISLGGVTDLLNQTQMMLAAVAEIPVTLLFGRSPGGQNATGEADFQQYYSMVQQMQRRTLKPRLSRFVYLMSKCTDYGISLPDTWTIKFNPLSIPSEQEEAETKKAKAESFQTIANALNTYSAIGAIDAIEVRDYLEEKHGLKLDRKLDKPPIGGSKA